ncbi:Hypothetical protein ZAZAV_302 [Cedratvirus Zaza IHUMI]|uniref:Uncharacterized protein n=1 Tax=Cedratvirus Zaza IHUMI TaxID=2126979 RepID=A0A2R8FEH5_9VIRU|nr:Hypothetical protein ZAZAV_302 [Cedratvirus Zaza IHUMI]
MWFEFVLPRSEPVSPRSEILVPIIKNMQVRDILRMSLLYSDLFDESTWRMLSKEVLHADWEYYSYLPFSTRKRFVEIAARKSLFFPPWYSVKQKLVFAILNQEKDLLRDLCKRHAPIVKSVCDSLSSEGNIYFNRPMINFAYQQLGCMVSKRDKAIADFNSTGQTSLNQVDYFRMDILLTRGDKFYLDCVEREQVVTDNPKDHVVDTLLKENDRGTLFFVYSITQEKDILEKIFETVTKGECGEGILRNLYRANHLDLAKKLEKRFGVKINPASVLSCLADYYFNMGDERGLYESLLFLERERLLRRGRYQSKIFNIELEEIASLLKRNGITSL